MLLNQSQHEIRAKLCSRETSIMEEKMLVVVKSRMIE